MSRAGCIQGQGLPVGVSSDLGTAPMETGGGAEREPWEVPTGSTTRRERSVERGLNEIDFQTKLIDQVAGIKRK